MNTITNYSPNALPAETGLATDAMAAKRFARGLLTRWKLFVGIAGTLLVVGTIALLLIPKQYTAEVRLIAGNPNRDSSQGFDATTTAQSQTSLPVLNALVMSTGLQSSQTYAELLQETPVAQLAVQQLQLPITPEALLSHVRVSPINDTALLRVQASWKDPQTAAAIANAMAQAFVDRQRDLVSQQADAGIAFIQSQLPQAEASLKTANTNLATFMAAHHLADAAMQTSAAATALDSIDQKVAQAQVDQKQSGAQLAAVRTEITQTPTMISGATTIAQNPVAAGLQQQLAQLQVQLADMQTKYTDKYPGVIDLRNRIADLKSRLAGLPSTVVQSDMSQANQVSIQLRQQEAQLTSQIQADGAAIDALKRQRVAMLPSIKQLPKMTADLQVLQGRSKLAQDAYYAMLHKYDELTVEKSTALSDLTITQPANADDATRAPNVKLGLLAVIIFSLGAATLVLFVLESFDARIGTNEEIEEIAQLPVIASIEDLAIAEAPTQEALRRRRVEAAHEELLDAVYFSSEAPPKAIAIVSPSQGEGKSTAAVNVALALAERHARVLLIDADLRRPSIHHLLNLSEGPGLGDILERGWSFEHAVQEIPQANLHVITCGNPVRTPLLLLQSSRFREFIEGAKLRYDAVVIDTCALNPVHDGLEASKAADATVLIVTAGQTRRAQLTRAIQRLKAARIDHIVGIVFNRAPIQRDRLAYYSPRSPGVTVMPTQLSPGEVIDSENDLQQTA